MDTANSCCVVPGVWTGRQFITGWTHRDRHPHSHSHLLFLTCTSLDFGPQANTQKGPRWLMDSNPGPSSHSAVFNTIKTQWNVLLPPRKTWSMHWWACLHLRLLSWVFAGPALPLCHNPESSPSQRNRKVSFSVLEQQRNTKQIFKKRKSFRSVQAKWKVQLCSFVQEM